MELLPTKYRKSGGLYTVTYPKKWLKLINGRVRFPLGKQVKAWFNISEFFLPFPSNLTWELIKEVRILPRNGCFYAEFVYSQVVEAKKLDSTRALGIDSGLGNWLTCVSTTGESFIVDRNRRILYQ
jgi:putative transposase